MASQPNSRNVAAILTEPKELRSTVAQNQNKIVTLEKQIDYLSYNHNRVEAGYTLTCILYSTWTDQQSGTIFTEEMFDIWRYKCWAKGEG